MLVDDDQDIVSVIKRGLEMKGFDVDAFTEPTAALHNFRADEHDLLILDIRMPSMSGIQPFKEIRKIDENVRVLFLTAFEIQEKEWMSVMPHIDANGFIKKPVRLSQLVSAIQQAKSALQRG